MTQTFSFFKCLNCAIWTPNRGGQLWHGCMYNMRNISIWLGLAQNIFHIIIEIKIFFLKMISTAVFFFLLHVVSLCVIYNIIKLDFAAIDLTYLQRVQHLVYLILQHGYDGLYQTQGGLGCQLTRHLCSFVLLARGPLSPAGVLRGL